MPLTRSFKETVQARAQRDRAFREALFAEGVDALLAGDIDTGKAILRDYINATVGFDKLSEQTGAPAKSLMRMLGPRGNPNARNLFAIIDRLQKSSGVHLSVHAGQKGLTMRKGGHELARKSGAKKPKHLASREAAR